MEHAAGEKLLGRYELGRVLAHGPTTTTYAAVDLTTQRKLGVRHWPAEAGNAARAAAELERAVELGKRVAHVHLPRYIEHFPVASAAGTERYLVHDAHEGRTLVQWAQALARSESELRGAALSILRVLDVLHRQHFVHGRVCGDEILLRADGRLLLMGPAAEHDAVGGVAGDLRGAGEALSIATNAALSPGFRAWLRRLIASDGEHGFTSAADAIRELHALPVAAPPNPFAGKLVPLALLAAAIAGLVLLLPRVLALWSAAPAKTARSAVQPDADLGPLITDTSFVPKPIDEAPALRLSSLHSMTGHKAAVLDLAIDPTGTRIVSAADNGSIVQWSAEDGRELNRFYHRGGKASSVAFMGSQHVLSGGGGSVIVWDAPSDQVQHEIPADSKRVTAVCSTRAGRYLVSSGFDGAIRVFDSETGKPVRVMQQPPKVYALAVDPNGERVASGGDGGTVYVFRFSDGTLERELPGHTGPVTELVFSADGERLVSASNDHTVRVWNASTGALLLELKGHRAEVWALAIDSSGNQIASGSKDGELRIWNATTGQLVLVEQADARGVHALAFSADGGRIVVGGGSSRVDIYALVMQQASWRPPPVTSPVAPGPAIARPVDAAAPELVNNAKTLIDDGEHLDQARKLLLKALGVDPKSYDANLQLARLKLAQQSYDDALLTAQRCEQLLPGAARTQALLIAIAAAQKQDDQVFDRARTLIDAKPANAVLSDVYATLRGLYLRRAEYAAAEETMRSEINLDPASARRKGELADFLLQHDRYDEAADWARTALAQLDYPQLRVSLGDAYANKARIALELGQRSECDVWLARAFAADKRSAEGHYVRALTLRQEKNEEGAERELRAALAINPNHTRAAAMLR